jgi:succinyl-diaminopimelate desuccinylase
VTFDLDALAAADSPSVVALAAELIRLPSRGGIDDYQPILEHLSHWLTEQALPSRRLEGPDGRWVGLVVEVDGGRPGPTWVLDACVDTAPFGDETAWTFPPTAGTVADGWLRGRGAADSKLAASMFCHLAAAVARRADSLEGTLAVLLDADEHTGAFGGAKAYFADAAERRVGGVMIGYPGSDHVVVGGRGVLRAVVRVAGVAAHSGSSSQPGLNAISRAASLIVDLESTPLPERVPDGMPLPPKLTVTNIRGGSGFSVVPDMCEIGIDVRLTDQLDSDRARHLICEAANRMDARLPAPRATTVEVHQDWPPYQLRDDDEPAAALLAGAASAGITAEAKVAGPSNIGNYLAGLGISATAGFGVPYLGLHGTDERARIDAVPAVHAAYHRAVLRLMGGLEEGTSNPAPWPPLDESH